jgi:hypothetical protein
MQEYNIHTKCLQPEMAVPDLKHGDDQTDGQIKNVS